MILNIRYALIKLVNSKLPVSGRGYVMPGHKWFRKSLAPLEQGSLLRGTCYYDMLKCFVIFEKIIHPVYQRFFRADHYYFDLAFLAKRFNRIKIIWIYRYVLPELSRARITWGYPYRRLACTLGKLPGECMLPASWTKNKYFQCCYVWIRWQVKTIR